MIADHLIASVLPTTARGLRRWVLHLGGIGLIPLALLDNSPIPIPGVMDVVTILLAAREPKWWLYYALMATVGSVIGGFITYRLARKGGKAALERRFPRRETNRVTKIFERWGFGAIAIPALLPPPVPMVPFLFAAGAMQYPVKKFLAALTVGRAARYAILAYLGKTYGRKIVATITRKSHPVLIGVTLAAITIAVVVAFLWSGGWTKIHRRRSAEHS